MPTTIQRLKVALHTNNLNAISAIIGSHMNELEVLSSIHPVLTAHMGLLKAEAEEFSLGASRQNALAQAYTENVAQTQKQIVWLHDVAHQVMDRIHTLSEEALIRKNTASPESDGMSL